MYEFTHNLPDKFWPLMLGLLVPIAIMLMIVIVPPAAENSAGTRPASTMALSDNPNAVAAGLSTAGDTLSRAMYGTEQAITDGHRSARKGILAGLSQTGQIAVGSVRFVGNGLHTIVTTVGNVVVGTVRIVGSGLASTGRFIARAATLTVAAIVYVPSAVFGYASDTAIVSAAIRPSADVPVPTIDTTLPATIAAQPPIAPVAAVAAALPEAKTVSHIEPVVDTHAAWPVNGAITTLFGVPHWPYQPTHTGIDISDGRPSGTTPVKPYRPGVITQANKSFFGLGNNIVVDHGGGVTSVYGHLASIGVQAGQKVDKTTVLGYQGTTGASTGTHLHFEIRIDGKAVDPRQFIAGQP